jgi:hypothetical protein
VGKLLTDNKERLTPMSIKTEVMLTLDPSVETDYSILQRLEELFLWMDKPESQMNLVRHIVGSYVDGHVAMNDVRRWLEDGPPNDSPHFEHTTRGANHIAKRAIMLMEEQGIDPDFQELVESNFIDNFDEVVIPTIGRNKHMGICLRMLITRMLGGGEASNTRTTVAMPIEEVLVLASLCGWAIQFLHTEGMGQELGALTRIKNAPGCDFTKLPEDLRKACNL